LKVLDLTNEEWKMIEETVTSLKPSFVATKQLQDSQLTLSDIYKILDICHLETAKIGEFT